MADQYQNVRRRILEIVADLAKRKSDYFNHGIESPLRERAALESELADLRLARFDVEDKEASRAARVRGLRGELLRQRLADMGLEHLIAECNEIAEASVPPVDELEATHG
jgi:hypothetical protein